METREKAYTQRKHSTHTHIYIIRKKTRRNHIIITTYSYIPDVKGIERESERNRYASRPKTKRRKIEREREKEKWGEGGDEK